MAQDLTKRVTAIEQWLQREEDELLYTPDSEAVPREHVIMDEAISRTARRETPQMTVEGLGSLLTGALREQARARWSCYEVSWDMAEHAFTPGDIIDFGPLPTETVYALRLATVETPLFILAAEHRRAVWLRDVFRQRRRYRQMHIVHRQEDLYGYDRPIVFLLPCIYERHDWPDWHRFLHQQRAHMIEVRL